MLSKVAISLIVLIILGIGIGVIGYFQGLVGNSLSRISREHSLVIPSSADQPHCEGIISATWLGDFGAMADFVIDTADLNKIVQQIDRIREVPESENRGINWNYNVPNEFRREVRYLEGRSKDGNFVTLTIYEIDEGRSGQVIRTQWN